MKYEYTENELADIYCPVCQHKASIEDENGGHEFKPCEHLAFVYLPELGEFEYQIDSWQAATDSIELDYFDFDNYEDYFTGLIKKSGFNQVLHIIENESSGIACGPTSFTEIYGYLVSESNEKSDSNNTKSDYDLENAEEIDYEQDIEGDYHVVIDDEILKTPGGKIISSSNLPLIQELITELDYTQCLDLSRICFYGLLSTQVEFIQGAEFYPKEKLYHSLLNDCLLSTCAGPERVTQLSHLSPIINHFKDEGIEYPHFLPQGPLEDLDDDSQEAKEVFDNLVNFIYQWYLNLSDAQRSVFISCKCSFGSFSLAYFLIQGQMSIQSLAALYLNMQCINAKVWSDIDKESEIEYFLETKTKLQTMRDYLQAAKLIGDKK